MGITMAGISLGAVIITPTGGFILEGLGWRATYLFLGLCSWVLVIPPILLFMKNRPQEMGLLPDGGPSQQAKGKSPAPTPGADREAEPLTGLTFSEAIKSYALWFISFAYFLIFLTVGAVLGHQIVFMTDMGIPMTAAAIAVGVTGGMGGVGKIVFGSLADRFTPKPVVIFCIIFQGQSFYCQADLSDFLKTHFREF